MAENVSLTEGFGASWSLLRRNHDFRDLYVASLISLGGDWFLLVALFELVQDLTPSGFAVALLIGAQNLTYFLASPAGGLLADRLDRRKLMVTCDLVRVVLCVGFLFVRTGSTVWVAYLLLAVIACFSAAFEPASQAALPNLVEPADLSTANALTGSLWGTMLVVGAAIGGVVTAVFGRDAAIVIDAISFMCSALLIVRIRRDFSEARTIDDHPRLAEAAKETISYARKDHRVAALIAVKFGWGLAGGVLVLIPLMAHRVYGAGAVGVGLLMSARGLGALVGPFIGRRSLGDRDRRLFTAIGVALVTFGVGYGLFGVAPAIGVAMVTVAIAHLGGGAQWMLSTYGLMRIVPDHIRGRIFAFDGMLVELTFGASSLANGWLADRFGIRDTAFGMGVLAVAWAVTWSVVTTDVRRATMLEGCGAAPAEEPPGELRREGLG